jgi:hypothetical protein
MAFERGRQETGGRKPGSRNRAPSVRNLRKYVARRISRHEQALEELAQRDLLEALKLESRFNRDLAKLLELFQSTPP